MKPEYHACAGMHYSIRYADSRLHLCLPPASSSPPPHLSPPPQGFNGADLRNVCTEAGMFAIRDDRDYVIQEDFMKVRN